MKTVLTNQFNMYSTDNIPNRYCLSYYMVEKYKPLLFDDSYVPKSYHEIISYCLRQLNEDDIMINENIEDIDNFSLNFSELKDQNITADQLLSLSVSIDFAEQYQMFLSNKFNSSNKTDFLFYNCTKPWFGPHCRFSFDNMTNKSFDYIVTSTFQSKQQLSTDTGITCYEHLHCQTYLYCLDWREICDGKSDCIDGSDEDNCWQLEMNECSSSEYRCQNGHCIPMEFFHDDPIHSDCLDRTDERLGTLSSEKCSQSPGFRCEEQTCRPGENMFPCGDGECTDGIYRCYNGRHGKVADNFCSFQLINQNNSDWYNEFCSSSSICIDDNCHTTYEFKYAPILFGHIRFIYLNKTLSQNEFILPDYICYNQSLCADFLLATYHINNLMTCRHINESGLNQSKTFYDRKMFIEDVRNRFRSCSTSMSKIVDCNRRNLYQCLNSTKCISKQRLLDGFSDCPFNDDEIYNQSCSLDDIRQRFKCTNDDNEKCFSSITILDGKRNCKDGEEDRLKEQKNSRKHIYFQTICDGKTELSPIFIDGHNETDETNCEHWQCNNTYSRCDGYWLCKNGSDEVNCRDSTCPPFHHNCVFPNDTSQLSCLPLSQAGNDIDDCLGGTDEVQKYYYTETAIPNSVQPSFHCWNDTESIHITQLCDEIPDCSFNDDEIFCTQFGDALFSFCGFAQEPMTDVEKFLCNSGQYSWRKPIIHFKLHNIQTYPEQLTMMNVSIASSTQEINRITTENFITHITSYDPWFCNRGIPIHFRMTKNLSKLFCLCPQSYYGNQCQYQNQRISLTIQIRVSSNWRQRFLYFITLIDNERNIHSYDYFYYLPIYDCATKYHIYLIYSTRPKNSTKHYSIQIDEFNQQTMTYRNSWLYPIQFSFLPVYRLAVLLKPPSTNTIFTEQKCSPSCIHGQCLNYNNHLNRTFCQCESGWSGIQCHIPHACNCAYGAICISDSICLCTSDQFGRRCYLRRSTCHSESCLNGGLCTSIDIRYTGVNQNKFVCICSEGYVGKHCEQQSDYTRLQISFHRSLTIPTSLLIHLIATQNNEEHNRTTLMKKIGFSQDSLTVYISISFNIILAQVIDKYYLIVLRERTITSGNILAEIHPSYRCRSINELFSDKFADQHLLKRIKYYQLPCQQRPDLVCFYDSNQFCLCTLHRTVNCFEFNHNTSYDCDGNNICKNRGLCFQDDSSCPTPPMCACQQCYFGSQCLFSTSESTLSLDIILGYHIMKQIQFNQQPIILKTAIIFTIIICIVGFFNSLFTYYVFRSEEAQVVGCGSYLLVSSILSMIIIIILLLKFIFLVLSQLDLINNRIVLLIQCIIIDFLMRFFLSISDWLSAFVAIERAVNILQGVGFNRTKSKQIAKRMIVMIFIITGCSFLHDPIHRRLIHDEDEDHTWCISQYSLSVQTYDWILNTCHFILPFIVNCISAIIIIIIAARTRLKSHKNETLKTYLYEQLRQHKHLLISPLILIVLATPRLFISFLSGCMKSARHSWIYMISYYISFIPSTMTFVVFVLPSDVYKKIFIDYIKRTEQR